MDLNVYLPKINSLYLVSLKNNYSLDSYIYLNADLKLVTFYSIINILIVISLFTCYYNAIYKVPKIIRYNKQERNDLLFFIWYTTYSIVKFFNNLIKIYNNIFFLKKYFFKNKKMNRSVSILKIYLNYKNYIFKPVSFLNFFKLNNNFFIFNVIFYKNSIYYNKKNTNF